MNPPPSPAPAPAGPAKTPPPGRPPVRLRRLALVAAALIVIGLLAGLLPRLHARRVLETETHELAVSTVAIVSPRPGKPSFGVPLPAEVSAYVEAPIYARASGYLKRWLVDIGDAVEPGQLLAEIETPELDQQLAQSKAELAEDNAALDLAGITAARWTDLLKTSSVSEQETAEKLADLKLKSAVVEAARANVERLEDLKGFARVTAPFAGTITERNTDVGQLITAGNSRELFRLAQTSPLRVYVRVPQSMSQAVKPGQKAELSLNELPERTFEAKVVNTAGAMEPNSRTLLTELQVDNSRGEILAGSYAQVRFTDTVGAPALTLPANALLFGSKGMQVGIVGDDGKVTLRSITLGRDFGQTVEVVQGLTTNDRVIINPADSLTDGVAVRVAEPLKTIAEK
ncbi:MAG: efflux RND transporter periplasmic adaptor subunit [Verrucomicrobiota bacterium]